MGKAVLRFATNADRSAIASFHADSWRDAYRGMLPDDYLAGPVDPDLQEKWAKRDITDRDVLLIAEIAGEFAGFIAVWCQPAPFIDNLHVKPAFRSRGLGRQLMQRAVQDLLNSGHTTLSLDVFTTNHRAIAFYEGLGGIRGNQETKEIFGNPVDLVTIVWSDLSSFPVTSA